MGTRSEARPLVGLPCFVPRVDAWLRPVLALAFAMVVSGCAGHAAKTKSARDALDRGNAKAALQLYNKQLEVASAKELPKAITGDAALLLLDRSLVLQQLGDLENSSRDLQTADKQVEMLDFSRNTVDEIGKYMFSDDTGPYKAPPYEKLMINTMNMINYLLRGDLGGARIEARRFTVMQKYLEDNKSKSAALLGGGSYLAGFIWEKSGNAQEAMLYYDEALQYGDFKSLHAPIRALAPRTSYRTKRIEKILAENDNAATDETVDDGAKKAADSDAAGSDGATETQADASTPSEGPAPSDPAKEGELLLIVSYGRVPAKIAKRVPIGLALAAAGNNLSAGDQRRARSLQGQGLLTWVNYPELERPKRYQAATAKLGNDPLALDIVSVDQHVVDAWDEGKTVLITSAITRMLTRAVVGEVTRKATNDSLVGLLFSVGAQVTMTAADTPDTRSWATLPGRIALARVKLPPGKYTVQLRARGESLKSNVDLKPGGYQAVNLTVLR